MVQFGISAHHAYLASALKRYFAEYSSYIENSQNAYVPLEDKCEESRIVVILLTATYIEALINVYLSMKLDAKEFGSLEKIPFLDKWTLAPIRCIKKYTLPEDSDLYRDLKDLIKARNTIAHMKPEVVIDDKKVHEGNPIYIQPENHELLKKWVTLPQRLIQNLEKFDNDLMSFKMTSGIMLYSINPK